MELSRSATVALLLAWSIVLGGCGAGGASSSGAQTTPARWPTPTWPGASIVW
ncbi:MAG: hypothetical protein HOV83_18975 [Catenulispora sp.]|nr:hypothetical protein [Catenulispora sp.]